MHHFTTDAEVHAILAPYLGSRTNIGNDWPAIDIVWGVTDKRNASVRELTETTVSLYNGYGYDVVPLSQIRRITEARRSAYQTLSSKEWTRAADLQVAA